MLRLVLPLALIVVAVSGQGTSRTPEEDRLKRFYEVTDGPRWINNTNWNTTQPVCTWFGITCEGFVDEPNRGVTVINLESNNLVGRVAKLLYEMPHMRILNLKDNQLRDAGLVGFQNTNSALEILNLAQNALTSVEGIGDAPASLHELHFTENRISTKFPVELTKLSNLKKLFASFNEMKGTIPTKIGRMASLEKLYLYGNELTGQIPTEVGNLKNVKIFTLAENALSGTLPREVSNMVALETFSIHNGDMQHGKLTGHLPWFDKSPKLTDLQLQGNSLTGTIPKQLLEKTEAVDDVVNISKCFGQSRCSFVYIICLSDPINTDLAGNDFVGSLPDEFDRFSSLNVDLTGNKLTEINANADFCSKGAWMTGEVEKFGCDAIMCPPGTFSSVGQQTGEDSKCVSCPSVTTYGSLECDQITDELSDDWKVLARFYVAMGGVDWEKLSGWSTLDNLLENNKIEDLGDRNLDVCSWYGVVCESGRVTKIELENNRLVGTLPKEIFSELPKLTTLDLSRNAIDMDLFLLGKAKSLKTLKISGTKVSKMEGISSAQTLMELYIDGLDLGGTTLPTELFALTGLEVLHVQYSFFTGPIPPEVGSMTELRR